ncbi:MAG: hypothetical protein V9G19_25995 [Tetrasphaera sp.]
MTSRPATLPRRLSALPIVSVGLALLLGLLATGPASARIGAPGVTATTVTQPVTPNSLGRVLDDTFRIRLTALTLRLDYHPDARRVSGVAELRFRMRLGQDRALFHFNPLRQVAPGTEQRMISSVRLDGRAVDPRALRLIRPHPTAEVAFDVPQKLSAGSEHAMRIGWDCPIPAAPRGWLYPDFDDTEGPNNETETLWPTVSSPEELVRHRIDLRVHTRERYHVIGSGIVTRRAHAAYQRWTVDTGKAISSSNVFFAAVPARSARTSTFRASGVPVTILTDRSAHVVATARAITTRTVRQLIDELGPSPMPRMQILLPGWNSGMEYYGATRTGVGSLRHELAHMYFATTAVGRTWRDTWIDEAVTTWWAEGRRAKPVPLDFRSHLANDRSVVAPGFNEAAYGTGVRVMSRVARALGGEQRMLAFLSDVYQRRAYHPFTTDQFVGDIVAAQDTIPRATLRRWLYG